MNRAEYQKQWRENNPDKIKKYKAKQKAYDARWKAKHPERYRRKNKSKNLKAKYGISIEEYEALLEEQSSICPICNRPLDDENEQIDVDHCHDSGKVRNIVHNKCNRLLACCEDSIERLESAIKYLRRHQ